jgi:hypothetical protein
LPGLFREWIKHDYDLVVIPSSWGLSGQKKRRLLLDFAKTVKVARSVRQNKKNCWQLNCHEASSVTSLLGTLYAPSSQSTVFRRMYRIDIPELTSHFFTSKCKSLDMSFVLKVC